MKKLYFIFICCSYSLYAGHSDAEQPKEDDTLLAQALLFSLPQATLAVARSSTREEHRAQAVACIQFATQLRAKLYAIEVDPTHDNRFQATLDEQLKEHQQQKKDSMY